MSLMMYFTIRWELVWGIVFGNIEIERDDIMQSEKLKTPLKEREWIEINGRKLYWKRFIMVLDDERWHISSTEYNYMICPIQELVESYVDGEDNIPEYVIEDAEGAKLAISSYANPLSAICDLFSQMESKLHKDLSALLDKTAELSEKDAIKRSQKNERERKRKEFVRKIANGISCDMNTIQGKITWILSIQEKKNDSYFEDEKQKKREADASELWCSILMHQLNFDYITYGQMMSLVQDDILTEYDISQLLSSYGDKRDFEWYSEDCIGNSISENTDLKIHDILEMAEPIFREILGL